MSEYYEKSIIVTESGEYEVKKVQSNHRGVLDCRTCRGIVGEQRPLTACPETVVKHLCTTCGRVLWYELTGKTFAI